MNVAEELNIKKALSNAKKLSTRGQFSEAIDIYNGILQQQPHNSVAKKNLSRLKKKLATDAVAIRVHSNPSQQQIDALLGLYSAGRMQEAENAARNLLGTYPNTLLLHNIYGAALLEQGKSEESLSVFEKAIGLKPDYVVTHSNLGSALHRMGRFEKAIKSYSEVIRLDPDHATAYANRGNVFVDLGQPNEALKDFHKALQLKPDFIDAYYGRGNVLSDQGQFEEALTNYDNCIELNPEFIEAYVNRGNTQKKLGRLEDAISSYQKAIQLNPEKAEASINLGNILITQGKFEESIKVVQVPLGKEPKNAEATKCLIAALNYCPPGAAVGGPHVKLQEKLQQIAPAGTDTQNISNETVQKLYQQSYSEIVSSGLPLDNYTPTQIWRGKAFYQGCDRHFVVFNNFNAIPKYCFSCYKVFIQPRTVVELFKLMIVFDSLKLPGDKVRKCMVEIRPKISGAYKGYIYCQGLDEGKDILSRVREVVTERISQDVQVVLKRGCSEYALAYPEYVQNDENGKSLLAYQEEWGEHEDYTDKNLVNHIYPPVLDSYNHSGLTLRDTLIMHNWLAYAAAIGDSSYMEISGRPVEKLSIDKRPPFQAAKE